MPTEEVNPVLSQIRAVIEVTAWSPAKRELIATVETGLGVGFPDWLRSIYHACNGFCGPTGVPYLFPLDGRDGVLEFTLFLRGEDWSPEWLKRAIIFGMGVGSGTSTTHWAALDGAD